MWNRQSRFAALVDAFSPDLHRYAQWLSGDPDAAQDLVKETYARAWRALDSLRDERAAKAWLITTLRRENARRFARKRLDMVDFAPELLEGATTYDTSTEAFVLRRAIAGLHEDYREPLLLQILGGFTIEEIAQTMDIGTGAATTRLFRARQKLRHALGEDDGADRQESG